MASNPPSGIRPPGAGVPKSRMPVPGSSGLGLPRPSGLPAPALKKNVPQGQQKSDQSQRECSTASSADRGDCLTTDTDSFIIGETVWVGGTKRGKITFIGETQFAKGEWAGIVLDEPIGKNDGTISGVRYFQCEPLHGTFTRLSRLSRTPLIPIDPTKECEVHGSTPPRCLVERQRSASPFTSNSPSPGHVTPSRLGSPAPVKVGERVIVQSATGTKRGTLQFLGSTEFAAGEWAGIELDQPIGKNDGAVGGVRYFQCKNNYGLFAPIHKISSSPSNRRPSTNLRRFGSKESMTSNISSVASSMAVRSARKPSSTNVFQSPRTPCLPSCTLQAVLIEKEKHVEQLIQEKDLDRNELAEKITQLKIRSEDLSRLQDELKAAQETISTHDQLVIDFEKLKAENQALSLKSEESARKLEDIQFAYEEENIIKSELVAKLEALQLDQHSVNPDELSRIKAELESRNAEFTRLEEELSKLRAEEASKRAELQEKTLSSGDAQPGLVQDDSKLLEKISEQETELKAFEAEKVMLGNERKVLSEKLTLSVNRAQQLDEKVLSLESEIQKQNLQIQNLLKLKIELQQVTESLKLKEAKITELGDVLKKSEDEKRESNKEIMNLKKLETEQEKLTGELRAKEAKIAELDDLLKKFEDEKKQNALEVKNLKKLESEQQQLTDSMKMKEDKITELGKMLQNLEKERHERDLEITKLKKLEVEHINLTQALTEKDSKVAQLEGTLFKLEEDKTKRDSELEQLQVQLTEKETRLLQEKDRTVLELRNELEDLQREMKLNTNLIENLQKEIEKKDAETRNLQDKINEIRSDRIEMDEVNSSEMMQLSTRAERAEHSLAVAEGQIEDLIMLHDSSKEQLAVTEKKFNECEQRFEDCRNRRKVQELEMEGKRRAYLARVDEYIADLESKAREDTATISDYILRLKSVYEYQEILVYRVEEFQKLSALRTSELAEFHETKQKLEAQLVAAQETNERILTSSLTQASADEEKQKLFSDLKLQSEERAQEISILQTKLMELEKIIREKDEYHNSKVDLWDTMRKELVEKAVRSNQSYQDLVRTSADELKSMKLEGNRKVDEARDQMAELNRQALENEQVCLEKERQDYALIQDLRKQLEETYSRSELSSKVESVQKEFAVKVRELEAKLSSSAGLLAEKEASLELANRELQTKDKFIEESKLKLEEILVSEQKVKSDLAECKAAHETALQLLSSAKDNLKKENEALLLTNSKNEEKLVELQKVYEETVDLLKETKVGLLQEKETLVASSGQTEEKLRAELAELTTKYETSVQDLNAAKESLTKEKDALVLVTSKNEEKLRSDLEELKTKYEASLQSLTKTKEDLTKEKDALVLAEEKLKSELAEKQKAHDAEIEILKSTNASLLKEKEAQVSATDSKVQQQDEVIRGLEAKIAELLNTVQGHQDASTSSMKSSEKVTSELKLELKNREKSLEDLKKEFSEFQRAKEEQERKVASEATRKEEEARNSIAKTRREQEDRNKAMAELEKELTHVKNRLAETEASLKSKLQFPLPTKPSGGTKDDHTEKIQAQLAASEQNVQFLNSIIVDLQLKNTELKQRVEILLTGGDYSDANDNTGKGSSSKVCRLYCDICGEFDIHDTEDCPTQSNQEANTKHCAPRGTTRPYCETCEVFGHATGSCNDEETF